MLKLSLTASGLLDKSKLDAWSRQKQAAIHKAVAVGMRDGGKIVADVVRRKMKTGGFKSEVQRRYDESVSVP